MYVFVGLIVLALAGLGYLGVSSALSGGGDVEQVQQPVVERPPQPVSEEPAADARAEREQAAQAERERAAEEERQQAEEEQQQAEEERQRAEEEDPFQGGPVPDDPTMYLTVPALGIADVPVINENSEAALTAGASHLPNTGFPWDDDANVYIAGHRLGYPGTPSDHVFYNLPNMGVGDEIILTDANGRSYTYAVTEFREVTPSDTYVVNSEPGRDMVSLQTCIEDFGDYWTEGPNWFARYIVVADRVA